MRRIDAGATSEGRLRSVTFRHGFLPRCSPPGRLGCGASVAGLLARGSLRLSGLPGVATSGWGLDAPRSDQTLAAHSCGGSSGLGTVATTTPRHLTGFPFSSLSEGTTEDMLSVARRYDRGKPTSFLLAPTATRRFHAIVGFGSAHADEPALMDDQTRREPIPPTEV